MTNAQIVGLGVRLFAIWLLVYVLRVAPDLWAAILRYGDSTATFVSVAIAIFMALIAVALWFFPLTVASKLIPRSSLEHSTSLPVEDVQRCGFLLLGLWVLSSAIPTLVRYGFLLYFAHKERALLDLGLNIAAAMLSVSVQLAIGVWLMFGARGLLRLLRWARSANT